jgi:hypothetical protein
MSAKNKIYKQILKSLKPLILTNRMVELNDVFEKFKIEDILSKEFINYCRSENETSMVIFICTLYLENVDFDQNISKLLKCYQYIQSNEKDIFLNFKTENKYLATICEVISTNDFSIFNINSKCTIHDCLLSIELLIDFDKPKFALDILGKNFELINKNKGYKRLAIYLCNRNSAIREERHANWSEILSVYSHIFHKVKSDKIIQLNSKLSLATTKICLLARKYEETLKFATYAVGDEDVASMKFQLAISNCYLNNLSKSIAYLDELISLLIRQSDEFISNKFSTQGSPQNGKAKSSLNSEKISIALSELKVLFNELNINIFLVSGTLLGFAREKNILSHDKDVDVGIFAHDDIEKTIETIRRSNLFTLKMYHNGQGKIYSIGVLHKSTRTPIDIFIYHEENNKLVTGVEHAFGYIQKFSFSYFDLSPILFLNTQLHIPENYELNLEENFGNWKIPDKSYISHLESPSTLDKGEIIYLIVLRLELLKAIRENSQEKLTKIISINELYKIEPFSISAKLMENIKSRWLHKIFEKQLIEH